jgi:nitroreductase
MELRDILERRSMHRAFLPDPIPAEQIERVAGVIRRAPSGGFSQGGSIVIVTEPDKRRQVIERFELAGTYADDAPGEAPDVGSRLKERQRPAEQLLHWQEW